MRIGDNTKIELNEKACIRSAKMLDKIFKENNVEYWLDCGTLLGVIRDKKFIPWDTSDIEFYMFYKKKEDILKILKSLKEEGFELIVYDLNNPRRGVCIKDKKGWGHMSFGWFKKTPLNRFCSFLCYYLPKFIRKRIMNFTHKYYSNSKSEIIRPFDGDKRVNHKLSCMVRNWLPIFFCWKLEDVDFYDFKVTVPKKSEDLLYFRYGPDWKIPKKKYESYFT